MKKKILVTAGAFVLAIAAFLTTKANRGYYPIVGHVYLLNLTIIDNSGLHFTMSNNGGLLKTAMFRVGVQNYIIQTSVSSTNKIYYK